MITFKDWYKQNEEHIKALARFSNHPIDLMEFAWDERGKIADGKTWTYKIDHPGEPAAGAMSFSDTVTISVESGDPGGDATGEDSFQAHMMWALHQWYETAVIELVEP